MGPSQEEYRALYEEMAAVYRQFNDTPPSFDEWYAALPKPRPGLRVERHIDDYAVRSGNADREVW